MKNLKVLASEMNVLVLVGVQHGAWTLSAVHSPKPLGIAVLQRATGIWCLI